MMIPITENFKTDDLSNVRGWVTADNGRMHVCFSEPVSREKLHEIFGNIAFEAIEWEGTPEHPFFKMIRIINWAVKI